MERAHSLALVVVAAGLLPLGCSWVAERVGREADASDRLRAALWVQGVGARDQLEAARVRAPRDPVPVGLLVAVELESGRVAAAEALIVELERLAPGAPEAAVLRALLEARRARPAASWSSSALEAYELAGAPDLSRSQILAAPEGTLPQVDEPETLEGFLHAAATQAPIPELAGRALKLVDGEAPISARKVAASVLASSLVPKEQSGAARTRRLLLLRSITRQEPQNAVMALALVLEEAGPEHLPALEVLEHAASRRDWVTAYPELYELGRQRAEARGAEHPSFHGFMLAVHAGTTTCLDVALRAEKQTVADPEERQRVAAVLRSLAARDAAGTTMLEEIGAASCLVRAAHFAGDETAAADAQARLDVIRKEYREGDAANRSLLSIGVPSIVEEVASRAYTDEARWFHALARRVRTVRTREGVRRDAPLAAP